MVAPPDVTVKEFVLPVAAKANQKLIVYDWLGVVASVCIMSEAALARLRLALLESFQNAARRQRKCPLQMPGLRRLASSR